MYYTFKNTDLITADIHIGCHNTATHYESLLSLQIQFSRQIKKKTQISNFTDIHPVAADRETSNHESKQSL